MTSNEIFDLSSEPREATYRIENIVASVSLGTEIDLDLIAKTYKDVNFNLNRFPGLCIKLTRKPKCVILLFKNGKMIITGLKFSSDIPIVLKKIHQKLGEIEIFIPEQPEYKVVNIVVSADIAQHIDLDLSCLILDGTIYEPEVFPGMIYRMEAPPVKCVFLVFTTGKFVITGLKREEDVQTAIIKFGRELRENSLFSKYPV